MKYFHSKYALFNKIKECETNNHFQQIVYSAYKDVLTQICWNCSSVNSSFDFELRTLKNKPKYDDNRPKTEATVLEEFAKFLKDYGYVDRTHVYCNKCGIDFFILKTISKDEIIKRDVEYCVFCSSKDIDY